MTTGLQPAFSSEQTIVGKRYCDIHGVSKYLKMYENEGKIAERLRWENENLVTASGLRVANIIKPNPKHPAGSTTNVGRWVCDECERELQINQQQKAKTIQETEKSDIPSARSAIWFKDANIPTVYQNATLSGYTPECEEAEAGYTAILDYAGRVISEKEYQNLIMTGNATSDKTYFGCSLIREYCEDARALYTTAAGMIQRLADTSMPEAFLRAQYLTSGLLFIDNLDNIKPDDIKNYIYPVCYTRAIKSQPTIYASGLSLVQLAGLLGKPLTDKIAGSLTLRLEFDWESVGPHTFTGEQEALGL